MSHLRFRNAQEAFEYLYGHINSLGVEFAGTKAVFNMGVNITNPLENEILTPKRKWNKKYADREWEWYMSGDRSVSEIKKFAPLWDRMHGGDDIVNSNYGYYWKNQWEDVLERLKKPDNRQAVFSMYDANKIDEYQFDTPCTLTIHFQVIFGSLYMTVNMRSCDLWYGFCNDQYQFSKLQKKVADELGIPVGSYYHFCSNLHIYNKHLNLDING